MLVLTRKSNQSIMIGDNIEVSVLAIMGEKVRIGIQASRDVPVFRKEVYLEIKQEKELLEAQAPVAPEPDGPAATNGPAATDGPAATNGDSSGTGLGREQVDAALRTLKEFK